MDAIGNDESLKAKNVCLSWSVSWRTCVSVSKSYRNDERKKSGRECSDGAQPLEFFFHFFNLKQLWETVEWSWFLCADLPIKSVGSRIKKQKKKKKKKKKKQCYFNDFIHRKQAFHVANVKNVPRTLEKYPEKISRHFGLVEGALLSGYRELKKKKNACQLFMESFSVYGKR